MIKYRFTEEILNSTKWTTRRGDILEIKDMEKSHIQNVMIHIYTNKDSHWLRCDNTLLMLESENGESFFQNVIRKSPLWVEMLNVLKENDFKIARKINKEI